MRGLANHNVNPTVRPVTAGMRRARPASVKRISHIVSPLPPRAVTQGDDRVTRIVALTLIYLSLLTGNPRAQQSDVAAFPNDFGLRALTHVTSLAQFGPGVAEPPQFLTD